MLYLIKWDLNKKLGFESCVIFMVQMLFPLGKVPGYGVPGDMPVSAYSWAPQSSVPRCSCCPCPWSKKREPLKDKDKET